MEKIKVRLRVDAGHVAALDTGTVGLLCSLRRLRKIRADKNGRRVCLLQDVRDGF